MGKNPAELQAYGGRSLQDYGDTGKLLENRGANFSLLGPPTAVGGPKTLKFGTIKLKFWPHKAEVLGHRARPS
jgi:hypothetical protein